MKPSVLVLSLGLGVSHVAVAGGLLLPGAGAVSTARAGTGAASTEGVEAISLNPAGMAKTEHWTITLGAAMINYDMSFQRNGTYDDDPLNAYPYEGQRYPTITNNAHPPLGIGRYQPVPVIGIVGPLGHDGVAGKIHVGAGLYTVNAYPFRDMNNGYFTINNDGAYDFPVAGQPPPPTRYDIVYQDAAIILPSVAASYRILPELDVGGRFSIGTATAKSAVAVWGGTANYDEDIQKDSILTLEAKDNFVIGWGLGVAYRATPNLEIGANYVAQTDVSAKGDARSKPDVVMMGGASFVTYPVADSAARCAPGGTMTVFKGCVELSLPMTASVGGRYKFLDDKGAMQGDLELDADWQNWSAASDYRVTVDALVATPGMQQNGINLKSGVIKHGLRDTIGLRAGGSWIIPQGDNAIIVRGGLGYETGAAKPGWERVDIDGAAREIVTAGGSYKLSRFQIDAGFGVVLEGTRTSSRNCNPMVTMPGTIPGCGPGDTLQPVDDRQGPDPTNPLVTADSQAESPVNEGTYKSHYLLFMLGVSTWF